MTTPQDIIELHRFAHGKYKHRFIYYGVFLFYYLFFIFISLVIKGSLIQIFILVLISWFHRRIFIPVLATRFESEADIYAAQVLGDSKIYREELKRLSLSKETVFWRARRCVRDYINERCAFLKQAFKRKGDLHKLKASIRRLAISTWSVNLILLALIFAMESDYVKSIGVSRYDNLCVKYYKEKNFNEAIKYGQKAVEKSPDNFGYLYNLAIAYIQGKEVDKAMTLLERVIEINPAYPEAHYNLGIIYGEKGWVDREIAEFKKAVSIDENLPDAHYCLGLAYNKKGLNDESISSLEKAILLYPPEDPWRDKAKEILSELEKANLPYHILPENQRY